MKAAGCRTRAEEMHTTFPGTAFTAQHSDCRVLDQLVYKWRHSRTAIAGVLAAQYGHLLDAGWRLTRGDVRRDARLLLGGAYEEFLAKKLPCESEGD